jgi:hypothetical protein
LRLTLFNPFAFYIPGDPSFIRLANLPHEEALILCFAFLAASKCPNVSILVLMVSPLRILLSYQSTSRISTGIFISFSIAFFSMNPLLAMGLQWMG